MARKQVQIESDFVIIEITNVCNFSCPYCFNNSGQGDDQYMSKENLERIIKGIKPGSIKCVGISGGEPYMHPEIDKILQYIINSGLRLRVVTNGSLLNKARLNFLIDNECTLQLSLDGTNAETHEKYRGAGSFSGIMDTLNYMSSRNYKNGIIRMTVTKDNYSQVTGLYELAMEYGFFPSFSIVQPFGLATRSWKEISLSDSEYMNVVEQIKQLVVKDNRMKLQLANIKPIFFCPIEFGDVIMLKPIIDKNGEMYPCHSLTASEYSMGNCISSGFSEILQSISNGSFAELKKNHESIMKEKCCACILFQTKKCKMGCPAMAIFSNNELINKICNQKVVCLVKRSLAVQKSD